MSKDRDKKRQEIQKKRGKQVRDRAKRLAARKPPRGARKAPPRLEVSGDPHLYDTPFGFVMTDQDPTKLNSRSIGGIKLWWPRIEAELRIRQEAERALREKFKEGIYSDLTSINSIIMSHFEFYDKRLKEIVPILGSHHVMEFLLYQYDLAHDIEEMAKGGKLTEQDRKYWISNGQHFRRAVKYLAECVAMLGPDEKPKAKELELLDLLDTMLICAEELVKLAGLSDQTFMLFPDNTTLILEPSGTEDYIKLKVSPLRGQDLGERSRRDALVRSKYSKGDYPLFDPDLYAAVFDSSFETAFGLSYKEGIRHLMDMIDGHAIEIPKGPKGFPIPFVRRDLVIETLSKGIGVEPSLIGRLLDGFTITRQNMIQENRQVWKPKQEYRAYRRGFFEFPHASGPHIMFSPKMAMECMLMLLRDLAFQYLPKEWHTPELRAGSAALSKRCGEEFETICQNLMKSRGFPLAASFNNNIGTKGARLAIPGEIGEMDCLAYSPSLQLMVLLECKLVQSGTEPTRFRDDLAQFNDRKGFFAKIEKKLTWVRNNMEAVCRALESIPGSINPIKPSSIGCAIITFYPSIASDYAQSIPCISMTEFFSEWDKKAAWPCSTGLFSCP